METSQIQLIDVSKLVFDPENPRLPNRLRGYGKEDDVIEWMIVHENVIDLMGSIGEKNYFHAEPLLVVPSRRKKGHFEVIEGNRRLSAVKLLNHPNLAAFRKKGITEIANEAKFVPKALPSISFEKRDDILVYLGYRHITGIKEWGPLAKARYLDTLRKTLKIRNQAEEYRALAKIIGSKTNFVRNILAGLKVYQEIETNDFFGIKGLDEVTVEFGVLYTAVSRKNIATFVGVDLDSDNPTQKIKVKHLKELTSWIFEETSEGKTRLGESRNLTDLDQVVSNSNALRYFREGRPLQEAVLYTGKPAKIFNESINEAINKLKVARDQMHHIDSPETNDLLIIEDLIKMAADMKRLLKSKLENIDG